MLNETEIGQALAGYGVVATYMLHNDLDILDDDDVKDALVESQADSQHFTDEQLDQFLEDFRKIEKIMIAGA